MAEPVDLIMPTLREMREEGRAFRSSVEQRLDRVEDRLHRIEQAHVSYRQALTSDTMLSRLVTGEWEERIAALESQMAEVRSKVLP